ncbi:MAG: hypothetical protein AAFV98_19250 [Chloroflexota bacterium]
MSSSHDPETPLTVAERMKLEGATDAKIRLFLRESGFSDDE